ncbi:MAG: DNA helicase RecQ, partial [Anaerolineales bacterium]|nr:DNA helicase RecQ [Anaerolineales bacterium]
PCLPMKAVIVAKTRMGSGACVGALTFEGHSLRLIAADQAFNDRFNLDYQVGEVWEIETRPDLEVTPPHVENVIVTTKRRLGPIMQIEAFIEQHMPPVPGGVAAIFDGLGQTTKAGALYIAERSGIPSRSTMFWRPDQPLQREEDLKRIRYRYPTPAGGVTLTFTGYQEPLPEIPAGTLLRVSLAHWWRPEEMPAGELRCYGQLSGWFLAAKASTAAQRTNSKATLAPKPGTASPDQDEYSKITIPQISQLLQQTFGYPSFRPLQKEIIANVLRKRDTLAVMPTGSGKSLCYQLPALLFSGLTVVVSPLIALMEDQVLELREFGIPAAYLNSTLNHREYIETAARVRTGEIRLLYAAPETLLRPETLVLLEQVSVDCLVIDEAHCISEWGHDFRPEYRQLAGLRARLPHAATLSVTATATQRVRQDIKASLGVTDANEFISSFDRENLHLSVSDKLAGVAQARAFLDTHQGQAGIIYCATREGVDSLYAQLESFGYPVLPYHAGLDDATRRAHQHRFRYEEGLIMVATIAFGMGINKSNLRFILHYDLPKNIESYYQQIGRAGRDGLRADCLLLFSYGDVGTIRYFVNQEPPDQRRGAEVRLQALLDFLETRTCRRVPLLAYFGEKFPAGGCGACDNCLNTRPGEAQPLDQDTLAGAGGGSARVNLSIPARQFLTCAQETDQIFGAAHLIDILRGARTKKVLKFEHEQLASYGVGRAYSKDQWRQMAAQFVRQGLLERTQPHGSLKVTIPGREVLQDGEFWGTLPGALPRATAQEVPAYDPNLFEHLRTLRTRLAGEKNVPPYVIFHDRALVEMATWCPQTPEEFVTIYGVGQRKVEAYGPQFLTAIREYCRENEIEPLTRPVEQHKLERAPKSPSCSGIQRTNYVWEQFQSGESIAALAADLGFTQNTILNHLKKAFTAGKPLQVEGLKAASTLSQAEEQRVLAAFDECGTDYLRPVLEALEENVSYDQLHLWRLIYLVNRANQNRALE